MIAALLLALALAIDAQTPRLRAPATLFERVTAPAPWSPPLAWKGQLVRADTVHVGVRAHAFVARGSEGVAATMQITFRSPF